MDAAGTTEVYQMVQMGMVAQVCIQGAPGRSYYTKNYSKCSRKSPGNYSWWSLFEIIQL